MSVESKIPATKIEIIKVFRVLLVTLLLNVYWPPAVAGEEQFPGFSYGEELIARLFNPYALYGCSATLTAVGQAEKAEERSGYTPGQLHIIKLLSSFFSAGCKVGGDVANISDSIFTPGERQINKLLSTFISSGCAAAGQVSVESDAGFSTGEKSIIVNLSLYFSSDCKLDDPKKSIDGDTTKGKNGAVGRHLQSAVLELFLLILWVFLKRV